MDLSGFTLEQLLDIQQTDLSLLKLKKELDNLPQRSVIVDARKKRSVLEDKQTQIEEMLKTAEDRLSRLSSEDDQLAEKQNAIQDVIDSVKGDYRSVESHSKELNGLAKRRITLEAEMNEVDSELEKIQGIASVVEQALSDTRDVEERASNEFRSLGGALQQKISWLSAQRDKKFRELPADLQALYTKTAARCGGIALGKLDGDHCSRCRSHIDEARLIEIRAQSPLSKCPSCNRLLVVMAD